MRLVSGIKFVAQSAPGREGEVACTDVECPAKSSIVSATNSPSEKTPSGNPIFHKNDVGQSSHILIQDYRSISKQFLENSLMNRVMLLPSIFRFNDLHSTKWLVGDTYKLRRLN